MYDHVVMFIISVTATVHEVRVKNGLLTEYRCQNFNFMSMLSSVKIRILEDPRGPIIFRPLSSDLKSLYSSLSLDYKSLFL